MGHGYALYFDWTIFLLIPPMIFAMWAQLKVSSTFRQYEDFYNSKNLTGADVARKILDMNGLANVRIERVQGNLTDHFDPRDNVVRLSDSTYSSKSVGAIGVAAHEVGHAVQHATGYAPIKVRNAIVPVVNVCSRLAMPLVFIGIIFGAMGGFFPILMDVGIVMFAAVVVFQMVTLPVEFNASRRALKTIAADGILEGAEYEGARKVLTAAAMTYVAAAFSAIMSLLRLILIRNSRRD